MPNKEKKAKAERNKKAIRDLKKEKGITPKTKSRGPKGLRGLYNPFNSRW